jgi:hypothetical protein
MKKINYIKLQCISFFILQFFFINSQDNFSQGTYEQLIIRGVTLINENGSPHIDGYISKKNMEKYLKSSASLIVSKIGSGRVVLFADNPNFRGSWYGTNKLFLNALFLGSNINVPGE